MMIGVVADRMPLGNHAPNQIWSAFQKMTDDEEGGRSIMLFQRVQNCRCISVFISAVKGKIDHLLIFAPHIISIIFEQFPDRSVSGWLIALLAKAKSPILAGYGTSGGRCGGVFLAAGRQNADQHRSRNQQDCNHRTEQRKPCFAGWARHDDFHWHLPPIEAYLFGGWFVLYGSGKDTRDYFCGAISSDRVRPTF